MARMPRSEVQRSKRLRRVFRALEPEMLEPIKKALDEGAQRIESDMLSGVPRDTGLTANEIAIKKARDGLTAVIGPGARYISVTRNPFDTTMKVTNRNRRAMMAFFRAYWAEFGTKGSPARNIPPQPARPFMIPAFDRNRDGIQKSVNERVAEVLRSVTRDTRHGND